jgi:hypothetical protein
MVVLTHWFVDTYTVKVSDQYICVRKSWKVAQDNLQAFRYAVLIMHSIIIIFSVGVC